MDEPGTFREHFITALIFLAIMAGLYIIWAHPRIILYGILLFFAILLYCGIYLIVSSRYYEEREENKEGED